MKWANYLHLKKQRLSLEFIHLEIMAAIKALDDKLKASIDRIESQNTIVIESIENLTKQYKALESEQKKIKLFI